MAIKWEKWDSEQISPKELLLFRNRALGIKGQPSENELHAMKMHLAELARDSSMYNLVALKNETIAAWMSGKFSERRLTDIIRSIFFDTHFLTRQEVDNLLYQLETSLPYPFRRIEIHGLGPGRESDIELLHASGYHPDYCIVFSQRTTGGSNTIKPADSRIEFDHSIYPHTAYDIYRKAFSPTWDRDEIEQAELVPIIEASDKRFSFLAFKDESPAGIVITNEGLNKDEAYLQVIAIHPRMCGMGIADLMMTHLEDKLIENGVKEISLASYSDNSRMSKFLGRWSFRELYRETVFAKEEKTKSPA